MTASDVFLDFGVFVADVAVEMAEDDVAAAPADDVFVDVFVVGLELVSVDCEVVGGGLL
jgi:hypothetical protein